MWALFITGRSAFWTIGCVAVNCKCFDLKICFEQWRCLSHSRCSQFPFFFWSRMICCTAAVTGTWGREYPNETVTVEDLSSSPYPPDLSLSLSPSLVCLSAVVWWGLTPFVRYSHREVYSKRSKDGTAVINGSGVLSVGSKTERLLFLFAIRSICELRALGGPLVSSSVVSAAFREPLY